MIDPETQADAELEFLEKAIDKKVAKKDLPQIQKILRDNQIPTEARTCYN